MFQYDHDRLSSVFLELIAGHSPDGVTEWLRANTAPNTPVLKFNTAFVTVPRKTGKAIIEVSEQTAAAINSLRNQLSIRNWSVDRLARVWLIMQVDPSDKDDYFIRIENLFLAGEVNELVALYSALPVLAYPEMWKARCAEGIRNNIGDVLTAIMCNNPYPFENLGEAAWNQLVLKAFFTDKPMEEVVGLDARTNKTLAYTLSDYAHERWAAHRPVNPQLWRCVSPFIDEFLFEDIKKVMASGDQIEREAAALAAFGSSFGPAMNLIPTELLNKIESGELSWQSLAKKMKIYVL
jgi:hypothetical protein